MNVELKKLQVPEAPSILDNDFIKKLRVELTSPC